MNLHQFKFVQEAVRRNLNLTEAAKALNADLIIIGTHGYSGPARAIVGSMASRC